MLPELHGPQLLQGNPFGSAPGHRVGQVGLTLLLHLPQEETIGLETMGDQMVLHNITVFVMNLTPGGFF